MTILPNIHNRLPEAELIEPDTSARPGEFVTYRGIVPSRRLPSRMDPVKVEFNRSWFAAGLLGATGAVLALRRFGKPAFMGGAVLGAATLGHMILGEPARPQLERVDLEFATLPAGLNGLRIGQLSDIHLGVPYSQKNLLWALEHMRRERPDLIVLTGDQVMRHTAIPRLTALLRELHAPLGVYAISGNHDHWEGLHDVRAALTLCGIPMLINENRKLRWNNTDFWLVGVDDIWDGVQDFERAIDGIPAHGFKLLLGHSPDIADEAQHYGFALQLAGHAHGGHLRLPWFGPFARPRFGRRYVEGLYQVGSMRLYVSRGLSGAPLRLYNPPEAAILTLRTV